MKVLILGFLLGSLLHIIELSLNTFAYWYILVTMSLVVVHLEELKNKENGNIFKRIKH